MFDPNFELHSEFDQTVEHPDGTKELYRNGKFLRGAGGE